MPDGPKTGRSVSVTFAPDDVKKLRKDFLTLSRNIKNVKSFDQALELHKALIVWDHHFYDLIYNKIVPYLKENKASYLEKRVRETAWMLHIELGSMPLRQDRLKDNFWQWSKQTVFEDFLSNRDKWFEKMRRYALKVWPELDDVFTYVGQPSYSYAIPDQIELEGFSVQVEGYQKERAEGDLLEKVWQQGLEMLKKALRIYKARASKVLPILLAKQVPLVIKADRKMDQMGEYDSGSKTIIIYLTGATDPKQLAHVLAHEMGHHLWRAMLSGPAKDFWDSAVRGSNTKLEIPELLSKWPEGMTRSRFEDQIKTSDPELYIQLYSLLHDLRYKRKELFLREDFERYLREEGPTISVRSGLPTGYSSKNPEEAFCETVGSLVAYGPKTVPEMAVRLIKEVLPSIRLASDLVMASRVAMAHTASRWTLEGFLSRHPKLRPYVPRKVQEGSSGRHPEASQVRDMIELYPKFWKLDQKTQDWVFAHEVGHFHKSAYGKFSGSLPSVATELDVSLWDDLPYGQLNYEEAYAECFAAAFLVPNELKSRYPKWAELVLATL